LLQLRLGQSCDNKTVTPKLNCVEALVLQHNLTLGLRILVLCATGQCKPSVPKCLSSSHIRQANAQKAWTIVGLDDERRRNQLHQPPRETVGLIAMPSLEVKTFNGNAFVPLGTKTGTSCNPFAIKPTVSVQCGLGLGRVARRKRTPTHWPIYVSVKFLNEHGKLGGFCFRNQLLYMWKLLSLRSR
jgi:hypothetical protein